MSITRFNPQSPANAGHQMYPYVSYATKQYIPASKFTPCQGDREVHKKREKQMSEYSQSIGISITNQCYDCMQLDYVCVNCEEQKEANDSFIAHELVDEGSDIYRYAPMYTSLTKISKEPSGHDWTERDGEFTDPTVKLQDGMDEDLALGLGDLQSLEDYTQKLREVVCAWCHLVTPKQFKVCTICDKPILVSATN